jgi:WD40 repeat protein
MYLIGTDADRIDLWNYISKKHIATLTSQHGHSLGVLHCCSSDGGLLAVGTRDNHGVIKWDISDTDNCTVIDPMVVLPHEKFVYAISFLKHREQLLLGSGADVRLYDVRSGSLLQRADVDAGAVALTHSVSEKIISVSWDGILQEWDSNLTELRRQQLTSGMICACVAPSEDVIAGVASDGIVIILDLSTLTVTRTVERGVLSSLTFNDIQLSADNSKILVWFWDARVATVNIQNNSMRRLAHRGGGLCYSWDGLCIYGSSESGKIVCLDTVTGKPLMDQLISFEAVGGVRHERLSIFCPTPQVVLM